MYNFESPEINTTDITKTILTITFPPFTDLKKKEGRKNSEIVRFDWSARDRKRRQKIQGRKTTRKKMAEKILISSKKTGENANGRKRV